LIRNQEAVSSNLTNGSIRLKNPAVLALSWTGGCGRYPSFLAPVFWPIYCG
jgi:hypothetical protein